MLTRHLSAALLRKIWRAFLSEPEIWAACNDGELRCNLDAATMNFSVIETIDRQSAIIAAETLSGALDRNGNVQHLLADILREGFVGKKTPPAIAAPLPPSRRLTEFHSDVKVNIA